MYMSIKSIFKCVVRTSDYKKYVKELRKAMPDDKVSIKPFEKVSLTKYDYVGKKRLHPLPRYLSVQGQRVWSCFCEMRNFEW